MDVNNLLNNIKNVNDYICVTQDISTNLKNMKSKLNITTVTNLKRIRLLEIEYFMVYNGNGAAIIVIEDLMKLPSSKTWSLLKRDLVALIFYWLDVLRKHLIEISRHWRPFLNRLLKLIKALNQKDATFPELIVEALAEPLLGLATSDFIDVLQTQEILHTLNSCCVACSREVRIKLRHKVDCYFPKLSSRMAACGHLPTQYSMLETLLRWLLPRDNMTVKLAAAADWFPKDTYQKATVDLFLQRPWQNFFQDARDFLNSHNVTGDRVTSVVCRKMSVGEQVVVSGDDKRDTWLDVNAATKSISLLMDLRMMEALGRFEQPMCETLIIFEDEVESVIIFKQSIEVTISIRMVNPPSIHPSEVALNGQDVKIVMKSDSDLRRFNKALQYVFARKYEMLIDIASMQSAPRRNRDKSPVVIDNSVEEAAVLSQTAKVKRRRHSGVIVRHRPCKSPSTVSTTSLLQLREKLSHLPTYRYENELFKVSAFPELSSVSELTEDGESFSSTKKYRPCGIGHKSYRNLEKNSQSDGERNNSRKCVSPLPDDEHSVSCLLVATIGTDEGVINDTVERLSKRKDYKDNNIVDLLVQEALQINNVILDSGINTNDNRKTQNEQDAIKNVDAIENTPEFTENVSVFDKNNDKQLIILSPTDDSNEIQETPLNYVSTRRKKPLTSNYNKNEHVGSTENGKEMQIIDEEAVDEFFAKHMKERDGNILVSPTLARKINETSSEGSNDALNADYIVNDNTTNFVVNSMEIIDCLNCILDKVCDDLEKGIINQDSDEYVLKSMNCKSDRNDPLHDLSNIEKENTVTPKKTGSKSKTNIKLTFGTKRDKISNVRAIKNGMKINCAKKMSPIPEIKDIAEVQVLEERIDIPMSEIVTRLTPPRASDFDMPLIRRKRKLYSPKEEETDIEKPKSQIEQPLTHILDSKAKNNTKTRNLNKNKTSFMSACYKEIENERKKSIRQTFLRKCRSKKVRTPSPKTQKMNALFDKLKKDVNNEDIIIADEKFIDRDFAVYNFTSDSEDENFIKKKTDLKKRVSSTTIASDSTVSRHGKLTNSSSGAIKKSKKLEKKIVKRKIDRKACDLADEKMREAGVETLDTSFVLDKSLKVSKEPEFLIKVAPQMEVITDDEVTKPSKTLPPRKVKKSKKCDMSLKNENYAKKSNAEQTTLITSDDRTSSPLPGLVVETVAAHKGDADDSVTTQMITKFKKIYEEGPECLVRDETNTTQNLLDAENTSYNPCLNITDDLIEIDFTSTLNVKSIPINNINEKVSYTDPKNVNNEMKEKKTFSSSIKTNRDVINPKKLQPKLKIIKTVEYRNCVEIESNADAKSEKSIATIGNNPITGHGDSDEAPPNAEELTRNVDSRNLELEDLDQSMKEYYLELRNELSASAYNDSRRSESKGTQAAITINDCKKSETNKSPVVSVKRLSLDDISKWLPSRRNSSETSISTYKVPSPAKKPLPTKLKVFKSTHSILHERLTKSKTQIEKTVDIDDKIETSTKSPASVKRLSPTKSKTEINLDKSISSVECNKINNITENKYRSIISPIRLFDEWKNDKFLANSHSKIVTVDIHNAPSSFEVVPGNESNSSVNSISTYKLAPTCKPTLAIKPKASKSKRLKLQERKITSKTGKAFVTDDESLTSTNSPVVSVKRLSYDDICKWLPLRNNSSSTILQQNTIKKTKQHEKEPSDINLDNSLSSEESNKLKSITDNNYRSIISPIKTFDEWKNDKSLTNTQSKLEIKQSNALKDEKRYNLRKAKGRDKNYKPVISSKDSKISTSTKADIINGSDTNVLKRKPNSSVSDNSKKRRIETSVLSECPTVSSVNDWLTSNALTNTADSTSLSCIDSIQTVMEKLDTTLQEIHQSTSKKFVHMFVEVQKQMCEEKVKREELYKGYMLTLEMIKNIIDSLADMKKRLQDIQENDDMFVDQLKQRAANLIREDCKQKRIMVTLLREDLQALMNQMKK
ncbi:uncharacterized protein LOC131849684 [Achroia grisella]|uniref:uncharacterized protein LOC131849684 n=1 Tax=Achroia grisella TaxID=688607 RepID=UPI0027D2207D|nr:uncharacterized protein LOC131849684 [Achroia grisella]